MIVHEVDASDELIDNAKFLVPSGSQFAHPSTDPCLSHMHVIFLTLACLEITRHSDQYSYVLKDLLGSCAFFGCC